jgi:site-specific DNA-methyltransferase (adenine-specific)
MTRRFVSVDAIRVRPDRIRKEFPEGDNRDLQDSIQSPIGMLQPIVLSYDEQGYILEAGERRLNAVREIYTLGGIFLFESEPVPVGMIPYVLLSELSIIDRLQVEVDENNCRVNFTWQERAVATDKLLRLRALQAAATNTPHPAAITLAVEAFPDFHPVAAQEAVRKDLILARNMHDPDVKNAKSADDAIKTLKRKEAAAKSLATAERIGASLTSASHTLLNADSLDWMRSQPSGQYDVILTDPPYGMGADTFGDSGGKTVGNHFYDDAPETSLECYISLSREGFRITKPEAHIYVFCDIDFFPALKVIFSREGWRVFRTPLLWHKQTAYRAPWPEHGPQRKYECILYAIKGDRKTIKLAGDVLTFPPDPNLGHPAQKPVALYQELLSRSAHPGDRVLDPFAGTGPILSAGHNLKCTVTAIELDSTAYGIAAERLQKIGS